MFGFESEHLSPTGSWEGDEIARVVLVVGVEKYINQSNLEEHRKNSGCASISGEAAIINSNALCDIVS